MKTWISAVIILLAVSSVHGLCASDDCSKLAGAAIYTNAFGHKETGDVLGYDLAIKRHEDSTVEAFFYIYEGAPNKDAIPLSGRLSAGRLSIQGEWIEHLMEYPSKKSIVQAHAVEINGVLTAASFRGEVMIEGVPKEELVRLKRVNNVWLCKN